MTLPPMPPLPECLSWTEEHVQAYAEQYGRLCAEAERDRLQARVAALEVDAERLDWLDENLFTGHWNGVVDSGSSKYWLLRGDWRHQIKDMRGNTLRAAVDTARKAKPT